MEMQGDSHNYKTITITYDLSSQHLKGNEIFHSTMSETRTHNEVKKLGQNQRQGWEQSCRKKSHRRVLATKAQSWSKGGQGTVFRSTVNVSLSCVSPGPKVISPGISQVNPQLHFASKIKLLC